MDDAVTKPTQTQRNISKVVPDSDSKVHKGPTPNLLRSVTTGQGYSAGRKTRNTYPTDRLGNSRAPTPKCCIHTSTELDLGTISLNSDSRLPEIANTTTKGVETVAKGELWTSSPRHSSFESTRDQLILRLDSADRSLNGSESDDDNPDLGLTRSGEPSVVEEKLACIQSSRRRERTKKVGRPIVFKGDPNSPELSEHERRRIKRRIANRESARRVRHKRQEVLEDLQIKMEQLQAQNAQLICQAQEMTANKSKLAAQLADTDSQLKCTRAENEKMQQEVVALRQSLQVKMAALEEELDRRAKEAETQTDFFPEASSECTRSAAMQAGFLDGNASMELKGALDWLPPLSLADSDMLAFILPEASRSSAGPPPASEALH